MDVKSFARLLLSFIVICITTNALSQPPRGPLVMSPQVNADKSVTFRYLSPSAREVKVSGQFLKVPIIMTKDTQGIWTVTTSILQPDIYPYSFQVNGINVMDPANVAFFPNERFKASLIDVPADTPLVHAVKDVPHGTITYEYYSSAEGTTGTALVYTPPGYDKSKERYPVFYLISGTTDTEETFFKVGRINFILDNLIAAGKASKMIVVMPNGNIAARIVDQKGGSKPSDPIVRDNAEALKRAKDFETDLTKRLIPFVESKYRTISDRNYRAIGGFSRGGGQTLRTAFGNMDTFSWICCYSAYLSSAEMETAYKHIYENPAKTNQRLKLLWISVGSEDFLYKPALEFMDFLKAKNVNYKSLITPGGHTWMNVKTYLAATLPLLFKRNTE